MGSSLLHRECRGLSGKLLYFSRKRDTRSHLTHWPWSSLIKVEEWTPPCLEAICNVWLDFGLADQGYFFTKTMAGEHVDQSMRFISIRSKQQQILCHFPLHCRIPFKVLHSKTTSLVGIFLPTLGLTKHGRVLDRRSWDDKGPLVGKRKEGRCHL